MHVRYQAALRPDGLELLFITTLLSSTIPERFIYLIVFTKQQVTYGYLLRLSIIRLAFPSCLGIDEGSLLLHLIEEDIFVHLDLDLERIQRPLPFNDQLIMRLAALDLEQHLLNLGRENVDALDDQHVVTAPHGFFHAHQRSAAVTGLVVQPGYVAGPVTDQGDGLLDNIG